MKKYLVVAAMFFILTGTAKADITDFYHEFGHGQTGAGGSGVVDDMVNVMVADSPLVPAETATPTAVVTMDGHVSEVPVTSVSVEAVISDNIQTYNIPISYGFPLSLTGNKELLNLKAVLPWTFRKVGDTKENGIGDISLTANYLIRFPQLLLDSKLIVKLPTGDEDKDVPLGTGSTDVAAFVNGTWYFDKFSLKGGLGYALNGSTGSDGVDYGDEFLISCGGDYNINATFKAGGIITYKYKDENKIKSLDRYTPGLKTLEITPSVTYLWQAYNTEFAAALAIPVSEKWKTGKSAKPTDDPDGSVRFGITVSKPF